MSETAQFQKRYQRDESTSGTGSPHVIRDEMKGYNSTVTFVVDPDPVGTGRIQTTFEIDLNLIKTSPGTIAWDDWPLGINSDHQVDVSLTSITGWRLIADSGDMKVQARGAF